MHLLIVSICYENIFSHLAKAWKKSSKSLGPCIEFVTHWCYYWALWVCNWPDSCAGHFFATQPAVMPSSSLYRMCFVRWGLIDSEWIMHYKWANTSLSLVPVFWSVYVRCFFISRITLPFSDFFFFFIFIHLVSIMSIYGWTRAAKVVYYRRHDKSYSWPQEVGLSK